MEVAKLLPQDNDAYLPDRIVVDYARQPKDGNTVVAIRTTSAGEVLTAATYHRGDMPGGTLVWLEGLNGEPLKGEFVVFGVVISIYLLVRN